MRRAFTACVAVASAFTASSYGGGMTRMRTTGVCSLSMVDLEGGSKEAKAAVVAPTPKKAAAPAVAKAAMAAAPVVAKVAVAEAKAAVAAPTPKTAAAPAPKTAAPPAQKKAAAAKAPAKEETWIFDNPNRKGRFPDSWKSGNEDQTSEARPKGAPATLETMRRDAAWLGTQTLIRDGRVMEPENKVPRGALNLPADTQIAGVSGFDGKAAGSLEYDPDLPAAGGNKGFGYDADPIFGKLTGTKMDKVPDFIPGLPGFNPTLPGGGWGGGAWILPKERRPTSSVVDQALAEKNKDVRVTAWDTTSTSTTGKTKTGWAGIFSNNQDAVNEAPRKDPLGTTPPKAPVPPKAKPTRGGARVKTTKAAASATAASVTDAADTQSLSSGWFTAVDKSTGKQYYYNDKGETTWNLPRD